MFDQQTAKTSNLLFMDDIACRIMAAMGNTTSKDIWGAFHPLAVHSAFSFLRYPHILKKYLGDHTLYTHDALTQRLIEARRSLSSPLS